MKKEDKWGIFLLKKLKLMSILKKDETTHLYVERIYPRQEKEQWFQIIWGRRILVVLILMLLTIAMWIYCSFQSPDSSLLKEGKYVERGEEEEMLEMQVTGEADGGSWQKNITLSVKERKFSQKERKELEDRARLYLEKTLPGENSSLSQVTKPLCFAEELPESEVKFSWSWEQEYIKDSGAIKKGNIPKEGVDTEIMAEAQCRNFSQKFYFPVHLQPPSYSEEELAIKEVKKELKELFKVEGEKEVVVLPQQVGNTKLTYQTTEEKNYTPVYFMLILFPMLPFLWKEMQKKKMAEREEQLLLDHPSIVNKTMLLLSAGLTVRKAVERMAMEYEEERKRGGPLRYAYEELCIVMQEMKDGVSEGTAMEHFGKRCRLLPYLRFSAVITQNVKKGAGGILEILEKESLEALEQRKEHALQRGEKASTKLLFPMLLMMGLVMGIIMIPAFLTM